MDRRAFVATLAGGLLVAPLTGKAQQAGNVPRVGVLSLREVQPHWLDTFRTALRGLGYVEGQNIFVEYRWGQLDELPDLAVQLIRHRTDVIVVNGTPTTLVAKQTTTAIPIVMVGIGLDPAAAGLVPSLAHPGGNVTGVAALGADLWGKRLELFRQAVPTISRAALLLNPDNAGNVFTLKEIRSAVAATGMNLRPFSASNTDELTRAFVEITRQRLDAVVTLWDQFLLSEARRIADLAVQRHLPTFSGVREYVDAGALMSYATSITEEWRRAATYVDKILKGAKPADLPIEQPTTFELVINLKTAKALGLTIPPSLLQRADQVIE